MSEITDRETEARVMASIMDAHGQWEIENKNRTHSDEQLWQDNHVRLLARAAMLACKPEALASSGDHAELARLSEAAKPYWHAANLACGGNPIAVDLVAPFVGAMSPARVLALLAEIAALRGENDVLEVERLGLRAAIFGSHDYDPSLRHGNFIEMARLTEEARKGALSRATQAERQRDEAVALLRRWDEAADDVNAFSPVSLDTTAFLASLEPKT